MSRSPPGSHGSAMQDGWPICRGTSHVRSSTRREPRSRMRIDRMKTEAGDMPLIAVGGGAFLVPDRLAGISEVIRVPHGEYANAVGAAIAQISGETDQIYRDLSRERGDRGGRSAGQGTRGRRRRRPSEPRDRRCRGHAARLSAGQRAARAGAGGGRVRRAAWELRQPPAMPADGAIAGLPRLADRRHRQDAGTVERGFDPLQQRQRRLDRTPERGYA